MNEDFLKHINYRGYVNQCTNEKGIQSELKKSIVGYIGFDCTADSLHVGSLLPLMLLKNFQKFGHKPIILVGGGTTLVGDPSGKDETRKIINEEKINQNKKKLKKIFEKFVDFNSSKKNCALLVDNFDWLGKLEYISFLRKIGSKFSINKMLSLESIKQRLSREQNLSFLEFNYSILQAYDFLELFEKYNCILQFGGSDQWGNIVSGIDLVKKEKRKEVFGLTTPLITNSSGEKMGKTADGAVWLSEDKLNSFDFWQFWRNTADKDVIKFLNLFTELKNSEIDHYTNLSGSEINKVKVVLANEITSNCHGKEKALLAEQEARKIIVKKELDSETIENSNKKLRITKEELQNGITLKKILLDLKLTKSASDSKRLILQGAIKINNLTVNDKDLVITKNHFKLKDKTNNYLMINVGKKKYGFLELIT